ncbi:hypothetical protein [Escherichia coli]|uniref:hypothetical protein n=1 Tax=Escherichia coli TaxID=562 RepID=UPI0038907192
MARRLPAFDQGVRVNAGRFTYANVVIQRCTGELIAQRRQRLFSSPIHICEEGLTDGSNCQRNTQLDAKIRFAGGWLRDDMGRGGASH